MLLIYSWLYTYLLFIINLDGLQRYELILNVHQTMATIKDETEGDSPALRAPPLRGGRLPRPAGTPSQRGIAYRTQEQIGGLLAGFLAAHAVGITDAMVAGH